MANIFVLWSGNLFLGLGLFLYTSDQSESFHSLTFYLSTPTTFSFFIQINGTQAVHVGYSDYVLFDLRDQACLVIPQMCTSGGSVLLWTYLPQSCGGSACGIVSTIRERFTTGFHLFYGSSRLQYVPTTVTYFNKTILFLIN